MDKGDLWTACEWKNMPIFEIDKQYLKMDNKKNSLWVEVKCSPIRKDNKMTLEHFLEVVGEPGSHEFISIGIEKVKSTKLHIDPKP